MMVQFKLLLLLFAALGHLAIWVWLFNRLHATPVPCRVIKQLEKLVFALILVIPAVPIWYDVPSGVSKLARNVVTPQHSVAFSYIVCCWLAGAYITSVWAWRKMSYRKPTALVSNHTRTVNMVDELGYRPAGRWTAQLLARFPGNEVFDLHINEKVLVLPRLSPAQDGLTLAHLSDLHLTGQITQPFFDFVIERINEMDVDLVAITGDIIDRQHCVSWIPETFGRLKSRFGSYYVLGNHDKRLPNVGALRYTLRQSGLIDLGTHWLTVTVRDQPILLAGNERPWFGSRAEMEAGRPTGGEDFGVRILLAHTPDQFKWARSARFDLMLAGHMHGGQICLPLVGPIIAPSYFGVKYASGVFFETPTLLHVSRGLSGVQPIRLNCPPELTKLVLRCATQSDICATDSASSEYATQSFTDETGKASGTRLSALTGTLDTNPSRGM